MPAVVRSRKADEDLQGIWQYVAERNQIAADRLLDTFARRWTQLEAHPMSGLAREDIGRGARHLIVGEYLILYRIGEEAVVIMRVIHGRRSIDAADVDGI